ncbi:MAG: hypothetical protein JO023_00520 [Chloroflexi bacterium]|nr:hypothetical protein [Chloroflexota bacterium]
MLQRASPRPVQLRRAAAWWRWYATHLAAMMLTAVMLLAGGVSSLAVASAINRISIHDAMRQYHQTHPSVYGTDGGSDHDNQDRDHGPSLHPGLIGGVHRD